ncbi:MAG TPA: hypothetical protein VFC74_07675 [Oscillospiraceae bacterium]|nr:hypothetical protein [Oscillospiraceae bacterium]
MEKIALLLIFLVFSAVRTLAENQAKKPQQKTTIPSSRNRPSRPFDQPLRKLEQALREAEAVLSAKQERPQRAQAKRETPNDMYSGEGVSLEHPSPAPREMGSLNVAPPLQSTVLPVETLMLQEGFMGDKEEVLRGMVYAEILGPPKAFRHLKRPSWSK